MAHCIAPLCEKDHVKEVEGKPLCQQHYDVVMALEAEVDKYCATPLEDLVNDEGVEIYVLSASQSLNKRVIARKAELKAFVEAGKHKEAKAKKAKAKGKKTMAKDAVEAAVGGEYEDEPKTVLQKGVVVAKHYASEGSVRIVAKQLVARTRPILIDLLTKQFGKKDKNFAAKMSMMMESPLGAAFHAIVLSFLINAMPQKLRDKVPYVERVVEELRVSAVADAGNMVAEMILGPLSELATMYFQNAEEITETALGGLTETKKEEVIVETISTQKQAAA